MKLLVTLPRTESGPNLFSPAVCQRLERCGSVTWNPHGRQLTLAELRFGLRGCTVCVTGWETPPLDLPTLAEADALRLVAHVGGTVAPIASEELYRRGVRVCSSNRVMARDVAEGVLAYLLASLRDLPHFDRLLHQGEPWPRQVSRLRSLYDQSVGLIGLGTVGRYLLDLLRPFGIPVRVYDPYLPAEAMVPWPYARLAPLDEVLRRSSVVSVHASLTDETVHLLHRARLQLLPDGALLINTARGAIIDEAALADELATGRIRAALDVYATEPLPGDSPLRKLDNVLLGPHQAGATSHGRLAEAMVEEVERFLSGQPLEHEVPLDQFRRMTRPPGRARP